MRSGSTVVNLWLLRKFSLIEVKTSLGAPHYILFPGSELVSCDTVKSSAAQAKIVRRTTRQAKIKGVEFFSGASEKQSTVRHLSILNLHCTLCWDLTVKNCVAKCEEENGQIIIIRGIAMKTYVVFNIIVKKIKLKHPNLTSQILPERTSKSGRICSFY
jgi:hypothetical protein